MNLNEIKHKLNSEEYSFLREDTILPNKSEYQGT